MWCRGLILDLSGLDFFGTEGFPALERRGWWYPVPLSPDCCASATPTDRCPPSTVDAAMADLLELAGGCMAAPPPRSADDVEPVGECQSVNDL